LNVLLTFFWFLGLTNALNLLDNMDGVAVGVAGIAALFLAGTFALESAWVHAGVCAALAGGALGFLPYNFNRASIFMGDSGSLFLGAMLAGLGAAYPDTAPASIVSVLFIPTLALAYFVSEPETPFWLMLTIASTAGLGGGNFASSMANISFFYPDRMKGWALGLNAAGGNIGVSSVQLLTPILMGFGIFNLYQATPVSGVYLQNAGLMWILPLVVAILGAIFFMNNLTSAKSSFKNQLAIVGRKHTWIMSFIYVGTFGSFIGYSAAFPLLIKTQFPAVTVAIAFLGPLVGSLSRPLGGLLADKVGGAIITFWNFIAMGAATIGVLYFVGIKDFAGFLSMFLIIFVTTGIGNGSTYRMIPSIFREENLRKAKGTGEAGRALALKAASIESGAAVGFIGAIGACGGYLIPSGFGKSIAITGGPQLALEIYLAFYAVCLAMTWWFYLRKSPAEAGATSLAEARI
jgi:NNP family nitrate/nitrite transporter-like MFS transporter